MANEPSEAQDTAKELAAAEYDLELANRKFLQAQEQLVAASYWFVQAERRHIEGDYIPCKHSRDRA